jgi:hypothetical protein
MLLESAKITANFALKQVKFVITAAAFSSDASRLSNGIKIYVVSYILFPVTIENQLTEMYNISSIDIGLTLMNEQLDGPVA